MYIGLFLVCRYALIVNDKNFSAYSPSSVLSPSSIKFIRIAVSRLRYLSLGGGFTKGLVAEVFA